MFHVIFSTIRLMTKQKGDHVNIYRLIYMTNPYETRLTFYLFLKMLTTIVHNRCVLLSPHNVSTRSDLMQYKVCCTSCLLSWRFRSYVPVINFNHHNLSRYSVKLNNTKQLTCSNFKI